MYRKVVPLATFGMAPIRRMNLSAESRTAFDTWLSFAAPRFGGHRSLIVLALGLAAVLGTLGAWPIYQSMHTQIWNQPADGPEAVWDDLLDGKASAYLVAFIGHIGLIFAIGLAGCLCWLRVGAKAAIRRRGFCARCGHALKSMPISESGVVKCSECAADFLTFRELGERGPAAKPSAFFIPRSDLAPLLWTRKRLKRVSVATAIIGVVAGAVWGGHWAYI